MFLFAFFKVKHAFWAMKGVSLLPDMETRNFSKRQGQCKNEQITAVPDKVGAGIIKVLGVSTLQ